MMDAAAAASSPDVGSSRNSTSGFDSSAMARESLRFCPPDRPEKNAFPTFVSAQPVSPMVASTASTRAVFSSLGMSKYRSAANATVSRHVRNAQCLSCCGTVAQNFVKMSLFIVSPLSRTSPTESPFLLSSVRRSMRHVFPAPEGPMIARTSPLFTLPVMPWRIVLIGFFAMDRETKSCTFPVNSTRSSTEYLTSLNVSCEFFAWFDDRSSSAGFDPRDAIFLILIFCRDSGSTESAMARRSVCFFLPQVLVRRAVRARRVERDAPHSVTAE